MSIIHVFFSTGFKPFKPLVLVVLIYSSEYMIWNKIQQNKNKNEKRNASNFIQLAGNFEPLYIFPKSYTRYIPYKGLPLEGYECGACFIIQSNSLFTILFSIQDEFPFRLLIKRIV